MRWNYYRKSYKDDEKYSYRIKDTFCPFHNNQCNSKCIFYYQKPVYDDQYNTDGCKRADYILKNGG